MQNLHRISLHIQIYIQDFPFQSWIQDFPLGRGRQHIWGEGVGTSDVGAFCQKHERIGSRWEDWEGSRCPLDTPIHFDTIGQPWGTISACPLPLLPIWDPILLFLHIFSAKEHCIRGQRPSHWVSSHWRVFVISIALIFFTIFFI